FSAVCRAGVLNVLSFSSARTRIPLANPLPAADGGQRAATTFRHDDPCSARIPHSLPTRPDLRIERVAPRFGQGAGKVAGSDVDVQVRGQGVGPLPRDIPGLPEGPDRVSVPGAAPDPPTAAQTSEALRRGGGTMRSRSVKVIARTFQPHVAAPASP